MTLSGERPAHDWWTTDWNDNFNSSKTSKTSKIRKTRKTSKSRLRFHKLNHKQKKLKVFLGLHFPPCHLLSFLIVFAFDWMALSLLCCDAGSVSTRGSAPEWGSLRCVMGGFHPFRDSWPHDNQSLDWGGCKCCENHLKKTELCHVVSCCTASVRILSADLVYPTVRYSSEKSAIRTGNGGWTRQTADVAGRIWNGQKSQEGTVVTLEAAWTVCYTILHHIMTLRATH